MLWPSGFTLCIAVATLKYEETQDLAAASAPDGSRNMQGCIVLASRAAQAESSVGKSCRRKAPPSKDHRVQCRDSVWKCRFELSRPCLGDIDDIGDMGGRQSVIV